MFWMTVPLVARGARTRTPMIKVLQALTFGLDDAKVLIADTSCSGNKNVKACEET